MTTPPARSRLLPLAAIGAAVALVVVGFFVYQSARGTDPHRVPFLLSGSQAPGFSLQRLDNGETVTLEQFKGQPVLINFWATWCGPCKQEHPVLDWGKRRFGDQVVFLGVVFEDSEKNALDYLRQTGILYPQLTDPKGSMAVDYGVSGVPETYFIDRGGKILGKYAMPIDPKTLSTKIAELIAAPTSEAIR